MTAIQQQSLLEQFLAGRALPEQWLGLFLLLVIGGGAFVVLVRRRVRDTRDEGSRGWMKGRAFYAGGVRVACRCCGQQAPLDERRARRMNWQRGNGGNREGITR